jgi:hypothetical protein
MPEGSTTHKVRPLSRSLLRVQVLNLVCVCVARGVQGGTMRLGSRRSAVKPGSLCSQVRPSVVYVLGDQASWT